MGGGASQPLPRDQRKYAEGKADVEGGLTSSSSSSSSGAIKERTGVGGGSRQEAKAARESKKLAKMALGEEREYEKSIKFNKSHNFGDGIQTK